MSLKYFEGGTLKRLGTTALEIENCLFTIVVIYF